MANEVKITLSADGNGLRLAVDGAVQDLGKLGKAASTAANDATTSLGATRRGILSISEQLATAQGTVLAYGKAMAAAFVGGQAVAMIKEIALLNARYEELGVVMPVVGRNAGYTATQMNAAASEMQKLGISMTESRNTTIQLAQAQISLADAGKLARIAQDAAVVGNMNSSEALASMIHGIKSGQIEVLRTIGINVNFEQSYKALANQIGVTTEELSEKQKMQARENAVLEEGAKLTGAYEAAMGTAGKQMRSMARYAEDLKVIRGEVFNEALTVGVMAFVDQLKDANQQSTNLANNGKLKEWGNDVADTFAFVADAGLSVVAVIKMAGITAGYLAAQVFSDNDNKTGEQIAAASNARDAAYKEDMAALLRSTSAMRDALAKRRSALKSDADARLALQSEFATKSVAVQKAYANQSLEVQRAAQLALAKGLFPQEFPDAPKEAAAVVKDNKAQASAYESLAKAIREKVAEVENEITVGKKLTDGEKLEARYKEELKDKLKGLSAARRAELETGLQRLAQDEKTLEAAKKVRDAAEDTAKEIAKYAKAQDKAIVAANAEVTAAQAAYDAHGKLKSVIAEEELARLENNRAIIAGYEDTTVIDAQIAAKKRLIDVLRNGEVRDAAEKTAKDAAAEWQKASDQIQQSLSDALMNAFTAGKGFGKTFVNSIKALFNTMVLRPVISAIVSPVSGALTSALGFSGAAQAAGTGGSLLSGGSSLFSAGSALASVGSFMGQLGTGLLASTQTALGLTATAAQASYAATMGVAAQTGSLIGSLGPLITAAPYLVALAGVYMLAKKLDHSGTPHTGGGSSYSASAGLSSTPTGRWTGGTTWGDGFGSVMGSADANEMTSKLTQSIVGILDSTAATFGQQAGYAAATSFADDSSKDGAWGSLLIKLGDTVLTDWNAARTSKWAPKVFSDGSAGSAEYLAAVTQDVRAALDGIDLPAWADQMLAKLGASASLEDLSKVVSEINATQVVLQSLGASVKVFAGLSGDAVLNIINASGGLQAFGASLGAYYENFYSDSEKFNAKLDALKTRLGEIDFSGSAAQFTQLVTDPTRENFRKLVEAQDLTTASGQSTYAALLGLSGVVAELTPVAEQAAEAVQTLGTVALTLADVQKLYDSNAKTLLNSAQYAAYRVQQIQSTLGAVGLNFNAEQITTATREQVLAGYQQMLQAGDFAAASAILNVVDALAEVSTGFQGITTESASASTAIQEVALTLADVQKLFDAGARTLLNSAQYQAYRIQQIQATLGAVGLNFTAAQVAGATRAQVLEGYQQMLAGGNLKAAAAILSVVDALAEVSTGFQGVTVESASAAMAVRKVGLALGDLQTQFGGAARSLLNSVQYTAYQVAQVQATLSAVGINISAEQVQTATREGVLAGLSQAMAAGNLEAASAILSVVDALSQVSSGFQTVEAAASNAAAVMQQRAGLESTLLTLTENTAAIRAREMAALDASNQGLQQHIYAIQEAQQAIQGAQQAVNDATSAYSAQESAIGNLQSAAQRWIATLGTASGLLDQISGALGGAGGAREAALWATVNGGGDIDARLSAAQELFGLINQTARVEQAAQDNSLANAKAMLEYGQRLRDYVQGLKTGNLSTLTPAEKVAEALAQYQSTLARAQGGDQTALGALQGMADTYLSLAREFDPASYTSAVFTSVTNALDSLGAGLVSQNDPQVTLLQAQLDATNAASNTAASLSAEQIAQLQTLQGVVQNLYAQAATQSAIANAQTSSAQANLQTLGAAQTAAQQALVAQQQAVVTAQQAATAYMATLADIAVADPVPDILRSLPADIAAALAPLLGGNATATETAAQLAETAARATAIREFAAALPQDDSGARMLYDAAVQYGVSSGELDAAMGFAPGSSLAWAIAHGLPAFAQGTNYVPQDMLAQIHKGEAIIPARYNPAGQGSDALVAEIKALRAEVQRLREQNNQGHAMGAMATERNTASLKKATEDSANQIAHINRLQQRAALA